ncbi:MAG: hypothetical protein KIG93_04085, partial [Prevotella sp.]|nr:hypothetical protein [Prevotella sp.]
CGLWRLPSASGVYGLYAAGAYLLSNGKQVKVMAVNHPYVGYLTRISLYAKYHSVSKTWMLKELHYPCLTFRKSKM